MSRPLVMLTGAHGSGKTTLAKILAEKLAVPFYPSRAAEVQERMGISARKDVGLGERLRAQDAILSLWVEDWKAAQETGGVFDRCPLDFAAYTLAEARREMKQKHSICVGEYVNHCLALTEDIETLFHIAPLLESDAGDRGDFKADAANLTYASLIHILISGFLAEMDHTHGFVKSASIEERLDIICQGMNQLADDRLETERKSLVDDEEGDGLN